MRGASTFTKTLVQLATKILQEDHPQTLRQLHYRIFSLGLDGYANDKASYRGLCRILTNSRRLHRQWELRRQDWTPTEQDHFRAATANISVADVIEGLKVASLSPELFDQMRSGKKTLEEALKSLNAVPPALGIPSNWIIDELRQGERVSVWENAQGYVEAVRDSYRRDNWQDQQHYVELWGEKGTVIGALRPIAHEWGLAMRVCRGFGSAGMEDQVGRLFEGIDKPITVLYVGDHDASGVLIERDMHKRVQAAAGVEFDMARLAIHAEDIACFNLQPQRIKEKDVRAAAFRREFGNDANTVELEALPAHELRRRIVEAVTGLIDFDLWNRQIEIQQVELDCIAEFADRMKNLPQLGGAA